MNEDMRMRYTLLQLEYGKCLNSSLICCDSGSRSPGLTTRPSASYVVGSEKVFIYKYQSPAALYGIEARSKLT